MTSIDKMSALEVLEDLLDNSLVTDTLQASDPVYLRSVEDRARELRMCLILSDPPVEEHETPPWDEDDPESLKPNFFPWMDK